MVGNDEEIVVEQVEVEVAEHILARTHEALPGDGILCAARAVVHAVIHAGDGHFAGEFLRVGEERGLLEFADEHHRGVVARKVKRVQRRGESADGGVRCRAVTRAARGEKGDIVRRRCRKGQRKERKRHKRQQKPDSIVFHMYSPFYHH